MDAADLRVFEPVARLGGMNRAAAELNTVQSNVTARIRLLEDELKTPLFERSSRGVVLTAAGRRLLPYAVQVRHLLDDARRAVEDEIVFREELAILTAPTVGSLDELFETGDLKIVVLRAGCSYRRRLEDILARRGVVGIRLLEFGMLEAVFGCVAAGIGVTLLPKALIGPVWRDGRVAVHELPASEAIVDTTFIRRRDAFASSALSTFLQFVRPQNPYR